MTSETKIRDAFKAQSMWCAKLGSPFTAMLMDVLAAALDRTTATGDAVLGWRGPPDAKGDSVPLRLAGGLHALVRRGRLAQLAGLYPPHDLPAFATLSDAVMAALEDTDSELCKWLTYPPQTNEVARSAVLYPGMMVVAAETGLPLSIFELGASVGLNLIPDAYHYRIGGGEFGSVASPVVLSPRWSGTGMVQQEPRIVARRGCDRNPLYVSDPSHRERLAGYIWPDQPERLSRIEAALGLAAQDPPRIDRADAADWVDHVIHEGEKPGVARVLFHSIAYQYFPKAVKGRITSRMAEVGQRATKETPLAWLAFEQSGTEGPHLTLKLWPGDEERILARADAHCRDITWLG